MKKILLCGFDPFGGEAVNPALEAVKKVEYSHCQIFKLEVPTVFQKSVDTVISKINEISPDAVVMIGQAGGRGGITPERVAINISDATIDDNEGNRPCDEPVVEGAPAAYFSTLPVKRIIEKLKENGIPASLSNTAGTFVCNHLMYGVLHHIATEELNVSAGFIHIPYMPSQTENKVNVPSLPLETSVKAIELILECLNEEEI